MEFSALGDALRPPLPSLAEPPKAMANFCGVGWGQILLGSASQTQHQEPGCRLTGLAASNPSNGGKWGTGSKKPNTEQLGKLRSLPQNTIMLARSHTAQQQLGPCEEAIMVQLKSSLQPGTTAV